MNMHGSPIFNFDRLLRGVFSFSNSNIIRRQPLHTRWQITEGAFGREKTFFLFKVSDWLRFLVKLSSALTIR